MSPSDRNRCDEKADRKSILVNNGVELEREVSIPFLICCNDELAAKEKSKFNGLLDEVQHESTSSEEGEELEGGKAKRKSPGSRKKPKKQKC